MLERIPNLPPGIDGIQARGRVLRKDYHDLILPLLEEARREGRRIRFLYQFAPDFDGFTPGAAWEDALVGLHYLHLFERCAVVADQAWIREASRLVASFLPCPTRTFPNAEFEAALAWLVAAPAPGALSFRILADSGVLVLEPKGPLSAQDFEALALEVDPWIESHGSLQGIVVHAGTFPGWENFGGLVGHFRFVRDHHRKVRRIALAVDGALAQVAPKLAEHFVQAEIKSFLYDQFEEALRWAGSKSRNSHG
jgi:hypothetical protein